MECILGAQTSGNSLPLSSSPLAASSASPRRAVKNLITKKFWHSVSLVLVAIYRAEFCLSYSLTLATILPISIFVSIVLGFSSRRSALLFLPLPSSRLRSRAYLWFIRARLEPHTPATRLPTPWSTTALPRPYWPPTLFIKRRYIIFY